MILHFIITVLVIYGVHASTREGMIFEGLYMRVLFLVSRWTKRPEKVLKPLFDCTPCMASFYGTISFVVYGNMPFIAWPIWVFALSGFNYILNKLLNK